MIGIVKYGSGNIQAIMNIYKRLNIECEFVSEPESLERVDRIILAGVGAFDETMRQLDKSGLREALDYCVLEKGTPVLGVCVGMQIMASRSEEGELPGLGWLSASVKKLRADGKQNMMLPHMGWNTIEPAIDHPVLRGVDCEKGFYFLHSYYFECEDPGDILSRTHYGDDFTSAVVKDRLFGFQFHPEKSHLNGITIFKNFAEMDLC